MSGYEELNLGHLSPSEVCYRNNLPWLRSTNFITKHTLFKTIVKSFFKNMNGSFALFFFGFYCFLHRPDFTFNKDILVLLFYCSVLQYPLVTFGTKVDYCSSLLRYRLNGWGANRKPTGHLKTLSETGLHLNRLQFS